LTVGQKVQTTLASLESVAADFKSFALETQNQQAKQMFNQFAQQAENMVQGLKSRVEQLQEEEPQYKQQ